MSCGGCKDRWKAKDRALVCWCCWGTRLPQVWSWVIRHRPKNRCMVSGQAVVLHVYGRPCPLGKTPQSGALARFMGIKYRGPSVIMRIMAWAIHPTHPKPSAFTGCGCVDRLKSLWERVALRRQESHAKAFEGQVDPRTLFADRMAYAQTQRAAAAGYSIKTEE